jgi:hypothetical protein
MKTASEAIPTYVNTSFGLILGKAEQKMPEHV